MTPDLLIQNGTLLDLPEGSYGPKVVSDFLIEFIKANKDEPFFVYNPLILPHSPFPPTPHSISLKEKDEKKNFVDIFSSALSSIFTSQKNFSRSQN